MRFVNLALVFCLLMSACTKDKACKNVPPAEEDAKLTAFNSSHSINPVKHSSGVYIEILEPGTATHPRSNSIIFVKYKGTRLDDTVFDQQTNPGSTGFSLTQLIEAWKIAIPMIGKGGKLRLSTPSALGYGCVGTTGSTDTTKNIKPNTPLYFEIELVDFY